MTLPDARRESLMAEFLKHMFRMQTHLGQVVVGLMFVSSTGALGWNHAETSSILLAGALFTSVTMLWSYANSNGADTRDMLVTTSSAWFVYAVFVWSVVWLIVTPLLGVAQIVIRGAFWLVSAL